MRVNLWDAAFAHVAYSVPGRTSRHIEWCRDNLEWDGVTVVTDAYLADGRIFDTLKSRVTVGWLLEGRGYARSNYAGAERHLDKLDMLLTHDHDLLTRYPDKCRLMPFGGCWIPDAQWGLHEKTRHVSHIYSAKNFMEGHRLRHAIGRRFVNVDHYGHGTTQPLFDKADGLRDYRFSIVIENDRATNYFTEKLLDCFALGVVPIYWGCPNIGAFFDQLGIIQVGDGREPAIEDIHAALVMLAHQDYREFLPHVRANLETAHAYALPEDYMYEHYLKEME